MKRYPAVIGAVGLVLWLTDPSGAYWLGGQRWASGSSIVMHLQQGSPGGTLLDGSTSWNAVTEDALTYQWTAPQGAFGSATGTVALQVVFRDRLPSGARLLQGQSLVSTGGRYRLLYQGDGNLVLYDDVQRTAPWSSNTGGTSAGQAAMQSDGNIVVYRSDGQPAWDRFSAN